MKYKLLFIFPIAISENPLAQTKSDLVKENLKGNVKSITQHSFTINKGTNQTDLSESFKMISYYNKKGDLAETFIYSHKKPDSIEIYYQYNYDKNGYLISKTDRNGKLIKKSEYSYNDKKNLVEKTSFSGRILSRVVYNRFKERDTMYSYNRDGKLDYTVIYTYNSKGNRIEEKKYKSDGSLERIETYAYDNKNHKIQEDHYDSTKTKTGKTFIKYDDYGNVLLRIDSNLTFIGGLPREKIADKISSQTFTYGDFDKYGNWKTQYYILKKHPVIINKREITYY